MTEVDFGTTVIYDHLEDCKKRYLIEQGGTRSAKTFNIILWLILHCRTVKGKTISIVRKTFPALRGSVYRDFLHIMEQLQLYNVAAHNKSDHIYSLNGNTIEFISVDQPQKIRGRKRNICFINEANEITKEDFFQLDIRTTERTIIDYNPSHEFWVDELRQTDDCDFYITTYKDNPFLEDSIVKKIERLKEQDPNKWKIYGLGIPGIIEGVIFPEYTIGEAFPVDPKWVAYGLDFGYTNDPTALIKCGLSEGKYYIEELIHETGMTNQDISERMSEYNINSRVEIIADSAEPKSIEELRRMGWNIKGVAKGKDSIINGIDIMKRYPIVICGKSSNLLKEFKNYTFKLNRATGDYMNTPIDFFNHGIDAARYVAMTKLRKDNAGVYVIR